MVYGGQCSHFNPHREYAVATHSMEGLGIWWESGELVGFSPTGARWQGNDKTIEQVFENCKNRRNNKFMAIIFCKIMRKKSCNLFGVPL